MNKNSLLKTAVFLCKFGKLFLSLIFIAITFLFINFQIDRTAYEDWNIKNPNKSSELQFIRGNSSTYESNSDKIYPLENWSTTSLYFTYLKTAGIIVLIILSIHQFEKVINSVKNLHTFQNLNVYSLRKIGLYCILIFGLNIFSYWDLGTNMAQTISFNTTPLFIALIAFILAEVFKEGNNFMEENQLTV